MPQKRPNILYIMSDDHGSGALSCYGSQLNRTPNLDRIAHGGMRLDNCYVTYSLCSPSRAAILTGKYAHVNGMTSIGGSVFDGSQPTFPKYLQDAGYQTAVIGKWHLHSMPTGFDHYSVMWNQGAYFNPQFIEPTACGPVWKETEGYSTDLVVDRCLDWLGGRDDETPFMLLCHFKSPHYNWEPDEKHQGMYAGDVMPEPPTFNHSYGEPVPPDALQVKLETVHEQWKVKQWEPMPEGLTMQEQKERNYQLFIKDYLRCVASIDDNVGRLLDYLDAEGLSEDTIVVYTSDNGMFQGEHGWVDKKMMYEESLRVPFVIRYPRRIEAGSQSDDLVVNLDYAPTFLEYAGLPVPGDMQGASLVPLLSGNTPTAWRSHFYYQHFDINPDGELSNCGIRTREHKLIWYNHNYDNFQLFDVIADPLEKNDVFGDPAYAEVATRMRELLASERERIGLTDEVEARIFVGGDVPGTNTRMQAILDDVDANTRRWRDRSDDDVA